MNGVVLGTKKISDLKCKIDYKNFQKIDMGKEENFFITPFKYPTSDVD